LTFIFMQYKVAVILVSNEGDHDANTSTLKRDRAELIMSNEVKKKC